MKATVTDIWRRHCYSFEVTNADFWSDLIALIPKRNQPSAPLPRLASKAATAWMARHPEDFRLSSYDITSRIVNDIMSDGGSIFRVKEGFGILQWLASPIGSHWRRENVTEVLGPITISRNRFTYDSSHTLTANEILRIDRKRMLEDDSIPTMLEFDILHLVEVQFENKPKEQRLIGRRCPVLFLCGGERSGKTHAIIAAHRPKAIVLYSTRSDVKEFVEEQTGRHDLSDADADELFAELDGSRRCDDAVAFARRMLFVLLDCLKWFDTGFDKSTACFDPEKLDRSALQEVTFVIDDVGAMPKFCRAVAGASEDIRGVIREFLRVERVAVAVVGAGVEMAAVGLPEGEVEVVSAEDNRVVCIAGRPIRHDRPPMSAYVGPWGDCFKALMTNTRVAASICRQWTAYQLQCRQDGMVPRDEVWRIGACLTAVRQCLPVSVAPTSSDYRSTMTVREVTTAIGQALAISLFAEHDLDAEESPFVITLGMLVDSKAVMNFRKKISPRYNISEARAAMMCLEYGYRSDLPAVLPFPRLVSWWLRLGLRGSAWYFHRRPIGDAPASSRVVVSMGDLLKEINRLFPAGTATRLMHEAELQITLSGVNQLRADLQSRQNANLKSQQPDAATGESAVILNNVAGSEFASAIIAFDRGFLLRCDHGPGMHCGRLQVFTDFYRMGAVTFATRLAALLVAAPVGCDAFSALTRAAAAPDCADPEQLWEAIHDAAGETVACVDAIITEYLGLHSPATYLQTVSKAWYGASAAPRHMFAVICCLAAPLSARDVSLLPDGCYVVSLPLDRVGSALYPAVLSERSIATSRLVVEDPPVAEPQRPRITSAYTFTPPAASTAPLIRNPTASWA